jgi:hypothetical protein
MKRLKHMQPQAIKRKSNPTLKNHLGYKSGISHD